MNKYSSVHTLKDGGVNSTVTAHILISHDWPSSTVQGNLPTVVSSTHTRTSTLSPTHTTGNWQFSAEQHHPGANHFPGYFQSPLFCSLLASSIRLCTTAFILVYRDIIRHVTWYSRRSVLLYSAGVIHSLDLSNGSLAHSANHGRANVAACGL